MCQIWIGKTLLDQKLKIVSDQQTLSLCYWDTFLVWIFLSFEIFKLCMMILESIFWTKAYCPSISQVVSNPESLKQPGLVIEIIEYTTPSSNHRVSFDEQELMGWWRCTRLHSLRQASDVWRRQQLSLAPELLSIIHSVFQASSVAAARRSRCGGDAHCHEKTTLSKCSPVQCVRSDDFEKLIGEP